MFSRRCIEGERYTQNGDCLSCKEGYYLLEAPKKITDCNVCPLNAICPGKNVVFPKDQYYRLNTKTSTVLKCFNTACLKGDVNSTQGYC